MREASEEIQNLLVGQTLLLHCLGQGLKQGQSHTRTRQIHELRACMDGVSLGWGGGSDPPPRKLAQVAWRV